uniref:SHSP domain-containing protein n=1 Tax=Romanomermis culicivorax TaxID=13658 RepID=A0A915I7W1_ROMCU
MSREQSINIKRSNYHVVDHEFDSMRERFDTEMKRVEEEMNRLRREFETYTPPAPPKPAFTTPTPPPLLSQTSPAAADPSFAIKRYDPYLENIKSPLIREESDGKTLRLRFDVSQYQPEEVTVKTVDNRYCAGIS